MTDFVRILENYCEANSMVYSYGRKSNLNLLSSKTVLKSEKVYLLHEPSPRKTEMNSTKTRVASYLFTGMFFLVVNSNKDMPYFNEMDNPQERSKYVQNIEPLLDLFQEMANAIACTDLEVLVFDAIDVIDIFDENRDGLLVTYQIRSRE